MAAIAQRGRLVVGVDQDTNLSASATRPAANWRIRHRRGREIRARAIFGSSEHLDLRVVDADQRESVLQSGLVDLVVRTYSITRERKQLIDFSTVYLYANQKILAPKGSGIDSAAKLGGSACARSGHHIPWRSCSGSTRSRSCSVPARGPIVR